MPRKPINPPSKTAATNKKTRKRKAAPKKTAKQVLTPRTPKDMRALAQIADRMHATQGALAILALSELFKWFDAIYRRFSSDRPTTAASRRSSGPSSIAMSLLSDMMGLSELTTHATAAPGASAPKRRGRPRKVQAEAPATEQTTVTRKRPGRPRKTPLPVTSDSPDATAQPKEKEPLKKKRKARKTTAKAQASRRPARKRKTRVLKKEATPSAPQESALPAPSAQPAQPQAVSSVSESAALLSAPEKPASTDAVQE